MPTFDSQGLAIAYECVGNGRPIVLVHGFAADRHANWKAPGWYDALQAARRRVVALDCRGHGESEKPHDPAAYRAELLIGDVVRLMDHLDIARADLMGYSMGGRIAAGLLTRHPDRFDSVILAGVGVGILGPRRGAELIAGALETDDPRTITDVSARAFREFAETNRNDRRALAACMRGLEPGTVDAADLQRTQLPVLIVAGEHDALVGDPQSLAALIPHSQVVIIPNRDHLTTVGDRRYKEAVVQFLQQSHAAQRQ